MPDQDKIAALLHRNDIENVLSQLDKDKVTSLVVIWKEADNEQTVFMVSNILTPREVMSLLEGAMRSLITTRVGQRIK